jgi:hypothetical protein
MAGGLQTIINGCNEISINRRNVVGIQYTRNEIPRVSLTPTKNPWKITLTMPNSFRYSEARSLMEAIDTLDRYQPELVTFSNNPKLSWLFAYQGQSDPVRMGARVTIVSWVGETLILGNLPPIPATRILFEPNDLFHPVGFPYPTTVRDQVLRGTGTTVTVYTGRPNIISDSLVGLHLVIGNSCLWNFFCPNMPTYKLVPGGYLGNGTITTSNALIQWSDSFQLMEWVAPTSSP